MSSGNLRITTQPKDIWQENNTAPLLLRPSIFDNFVIETRVRISPTADHHQGGLVLYGNDNNYVRLTYVYISELGGPAFEFGREVQGVFTPIQIRASSRNDYYLRIQKLNNNYYGYYSSDGRTWQLIGTHTAVLVNVAAVGITAFNAVNATTSEINADFDYVEVRSFQVEKLYLPLLSR